MLPKLPRVLTEKQNLTPSHTKSPRMSTTTSDTDILNQLTHSPLNIIGSKPILPPLNVQHSKPTWVNEEAKYRENNGAQILSRGQKDTWKADVNIRRPTLTLPPLNTYKELTLLNVKEEAVGNSQKKILEKAKNIGMKTYQVLRANHRGEWRIYDPMHLEGDGELPKPAMYTFLRMQSGEMRVSKSTNGTTSHYIVAEGESVLFAGEAIFNILGELVSFNNQSGCYQPPAELVHQAGLPRALFAPFVKKEVVLPRTSSDRVDSSPNHEVPHKMLYDTFKDKSFLHHTCDNPECEHCEPIMGE